VKRYFYIGDDLKDLKLISSELEGNGFAKPQIHLITKNHDISYLDSLMPIQHDFLKILFRKENMVILTVLFSAILASGAIFLQLKPAYVAILFTLSIFIFFQLFKSNNEETNLEHFDQSNIKQQLQNGRYILLVELTNTQEKALDKVIINHPNIEAAGIHVHN
jgi:hypothetical protein